MQPTVMLSWLCSRRSEWVYTLLLCVSYVFKRFAVAPSVFAVASAFRRTLLLQVVFEQNMLDLVERASAYRTDPTA